MSKGQMVVLRETLAFAIGLSVMISISGFFANNVAPEISEMSVSVQLRSVLNHINSLITEVNSRLKGVNSSLSIFDELPSMIGTTRFRAYVKSGDLCVKSIGQFITNQCLELRLSNSSVSGNYLSGSDIQITGSVNDSGTFINFKNKL